MIESPNPDIDVDGLMRRIRAKIENAREDGGDLPRLADDHDLALRVPPVAGPRALHPAFDPEPRRRYQLAELLSFHDEMFIRVAYATILRREPDAIGLRDGLGLLRSGASRVDILGRLRYSAEGNAAGVEIEGLRVRAALNKLYRVPVLGRLLRMTTAIWNLPEALKDQRAFENRVMALFDDLHAAARAESVVLRNGLQALDENLRTRYRRHQTYAGILRRAISELMHSKADAESVTAFLRESLSDAIAPLAESLEGKVSVPAMDRLAMETKSSIAGVQQVSTDLKVSLVEQEHRLRTLLEEARKRLPAPLATEQLTAMVGEEGHLLDAMYAAFEDRFRGTRAEIRQRQAVYLPYIGKAKAGGPDSPVIDLGCGRGEWLELLREVGLTARGADLNRVFLRECAERNLVAEEQDAIEYLRGMKSGSAGAITAFHLIEHLPVRGAIDLIDEALRVLRAGGVIIIETPDPSNLVVGACNFYVDPTHRNPLPSELSKFWVEVRGFVDVEVVPLHPVEVDWLQGSTDPMALAVNHHLNGPRDYAVIGWKA